MHSLLRIVASCRLPCVAAAPVMFADHTTSKEAKPSSLQASNILNYEMTKLFEDPVGVAATLLKSTSRKAQHKVEVGITMNKPIERRKMQIEKER